ncbi:MAG TPA: sugar transferase [Candidatus Acidoferrum sp.]|nr:sugar transferase [Candidatus Acidoferrum sp.]
MTETFYKRFGKRWLDIVCSFAGLIVLSPIFLLVALAVKLTSNGPIFFRQTRVGQFGDLFRILKFRTMRVENAVGASLITASGDPRITPVGRFLRKTKIDELPQLMNVLLGEMSLVGPRPEVSKYVAIYSESQRLVLLIQPGITGLAAMNNAQEDELLAAQQDKERFYRAVLLPAKVAIDMAYCKNVRFTEDLRIIFATFVKIFRRSDGISNSLVHAPEKLS